jgi:hypothetical protein
MTRPAIDALTDEFNDWRKANKVTFEGDAMELFRFAGHMITDAARTWLWDFIQRWEAAEQADPAFYDQQTIEDIPETNYPGAF